MKEIIKLLSLKSYRLNKKIRIYLNIKDNSNILYKILSLYLYDSLVVKNHIIIGHKSRIGKNILFPHMHNIVIGEFAKIGDNCIIYQDVTIGQNKGKYPCIGNNVIIYAGAKIIGDIDIGDNAIVGANSVVTKNVPKSTIVAGIPAKAIGHRSKQDGFY